MWPEYCCLLWCDISTHMCILTWYFTKWKDLQLTYLYWHAWESTILLFYCWVIPSWQLPSINTPIPNPDRVLLQYHQLWIRHTALSFLCNELYLSTMLSILHSHVLYNHNISLSCGSQHSQTRLWHYYASYFQFTNVNRGVGMLVSKTVKKLCEGWQYILERHGIQSAHKQPRICIFFL